MGLITFKEHKHKIIFLQETKLNCHYVHMAAGEVAVVQTISTWA